MIAHELGICTTALNMYLKQPSNEKAKNQKVHKVPDETLNAKNPQLQIRMPIMPGIDEKREGHCIR
jgi:hypothetical protein